MRKLWLREETKFEQWHEVELAVLYARVVLGELPMDAYEAIKAHSKINLALIEKLEAEYEHDMLAFIGAVQESLTAANAGQYRAEYHKRLTSYDVEDPALILMLRQATELIIAELGNLEATLRRRAREHQWTLMIAATHGQDAEPTTFGHLLLIYAEAVRRSIERLEWVLVHELSEGKISGAIGNYADVTPAIEANALQRLKLRPANAESQILQRDRHAMLLATIAVAGGTIEQMSRTFWEMCRSRCRELREPRKPKQRGSSAMPWKINPIKLEQFQGLPRLLRAFAQAAGENIATPDFRDISQSSVERHIFPDATALLHYLAVKMTAVVDGLVVFPDRMLQNLEASCGVWAGNRVRTALLEAGVDPDVAYEYVQSVSAKAIERRVNVHELFRLDRINDSRTAAKIIGADRLASFFNLRAYVERGITHIFGKEKPIV